MKKDKSIDIDSNFCSSIGFILARQVKLLAFVPPKAKNEFFDRYEEATGQIITGNEQGLVLHPEGTNKYWYESRIIFKATERETLRLFLFCGDIVKGSDKEHWNLNSNDVFFELLRLGFQLGGNQPIESIKANIPTSFQLSFQDGFTRGCG